MERTKRELTPAEQIVLNELWRRKQRHQPAYGYVTTTAEVPMDGKDGEGPWSSPDRIIPAGSTLKIVMVSRFGDFGLTDNLAAECGYGVRLDWDDAAMKDIRLTQ